MSYEVNDCLGITQFVTSYLNEDQAVLYLLGIDAITLEEWKQAKSFLQSVDKTKRQTKETNIRDIVRVFINEEVEQQFLVKNLALCPGFQAKALSYTIATIEAVNSHINSTLAKLPSRLINHQPPAQANTSTLQATTIGSISPAAVTSTSQGIDKPAVDNSCAPPTSWPDTEKILPYKPLNKRSKSIKQNNTSAWVHGATSALDNTKKPQLKFVCLGVRSGPDETTDSLKQELKKCTIYRDLKVEAVSKNHFNTMFRVKFSVAAAHCEKWKEPKSWPSRMSAALWRGNPQKVLQKLETREYSKKIYIGNLSTEITDNQIQSNMEKIYAEEISSQKIKGIEIVPNREGATRSVCVVLTSCPGKEMSEIPLKIDHFPRRMTRWVRWWKGPIPYPESHQKSQGKTTLNW